MESDSNIKPFFIVNPKCTVYLKIHLITPSQPKLFESLLKVLFHISIGTPLLSCHTLLHVVAWLHYCHVTLCYMLLRAVGSCCAKSETGQTFEPTTHIISFVPWSPKLSQFTWITRYRVLWVVSFPRRTPGPSNVASVCT